MVSRSFKKIGHRRGNAVLEVALVLPVLLALTFGSIEYGYFFYMKNMAAGAAREGVRMLALSGKGTTDADTAIANYLQNAHLDSTMYNTAYSGDPTKSNTEVGVTITMTWSTVGIPMPTMLGGIGPNKQIIASAAMMKE